MALIPTIGSSGIFTLAAPFNTLPAPNTSYRCEAIRRLRDVVQEGIDPFEEYYAPWGLTRAVYDQDNLNNVSIVSLSSAADHWVHVPTSYIQSYPNVNGVAYTAMILAVDVGAIPNYKDLSFVKHQISEVVRDTLGITNVVIDTVARSRTENLSQSDHDAVEANRAMLIRTTTTDRSQVLALQTQVAQLRQRNQELEAYIASRH